MEFRKFTSLDNSYQKRVVNRVKEQGIDKGTRWVVSEKIDGCCYALYVSNDGVKHASRNQFVGDGFYGSLSTTEKYIPHAQAVFNHLNSEGDLSHAIFRGELYGEGIQNRVYYGEKDFRVFEIELIGLDNNSVTLTTTLADIVLKTVEQEVALQTVPILGVFNTLEEALGVSRDFKSLLTPDGYEKDNWSEGTAITTTHPKWFDNGSRVYFKNKSEYFKEKGGPKKKEVAALEYGDQELLNSVLPYLNENRVLSATSKIGNSFQQFGDILREVKQDIENAYSLDFRKEWYNGAVDEKRIMKEFNTACSQSVREVLKKFQ